MVMQPLLQKRQRSDQLERQVEPCPFGGCTSHLNRQWRVCGNEWLSRAVGETEGQQGKRAAGSDRLVQRASMVRLIMEARCRS